MKEPQTLLEKSLQYLIEETLQEKKRKKPKKQSVNAPEIHDAVYQAHIAARRKIPLIEVKNAIGKRVSKKKKLEIDRDFEEENWTMARTSLRQRDLFKS